MYIYVEVHSSACHAYVMWAELCNCHLPFFIRAGRFKHSSNHWNGTGTKNAFKWNRALGFEFSIQSSVYGATTVAKVSLFSTWTRSTVSFFSM